MLGSLEIIMFRFPGLESPGKRHRSWNSKVMVLEILLPAPPLAGSPSSPWYHDLYNITQHVCRKDKYFIWHFCCDFEVSGCSVAPNFKFSSLQLKHVF